RFAGPGGRSSDLERPKKSCNRTSHARLYLYEIGNERGNFLSRSHAGTAPHPRRRHATRLPSHLPGLRKHGSEASIFEGQAGGYRVSKKPGKFRKPSRPPKIGGSVAGRPVGPLGPDTFCRLIVRFSVFCFLEVSPCQCQSRRSVASASQGWRNGLRRA